MRGICSGVLALLLVCACSAPYDVGYLRRQLDSGADPGQIEEALVGLSNEGYEEADLALADLYLTRDDADSLRRSCSIYEKLAGVSEKARFKHAKCLARLSYVQPSARESAHRELLEVAGRDSEMLPELARFFSFHSQYYPATELKKVLSRMEEQQVDRQTFLEVVLRSAEPAQFEEKVRTACSAPADELTLSQCEQIRLKTALLADDAEEIATILKRLHERYQAASESGLGQVGEETLYECSRLLLRDDIGGCRLLDGLNLAALGISQSERLFLLVAKYDYKQKILLETADLLAGLERSASKGDEEAMMILGRMYSRGFRVVENPARAEQYLLKTAEDPKGALYLGRLYLSGKLGAERLQDGVDTLLYAARHGRFEAYMELAEAFNGFPGITRNPDYAWVFARMGARYMSNPDQLGKMLKMLGKIEQSWLDRAPPRHLLENENLKMQQAISSSST